MATSLRELIYVKNYSDKTQNKLLFIVGSNDWVEQLFDLIEEMDDKLDENNPEDDSIIKIGNIVIPNKSITITKK
jgi:hypothetical protein